MLKRNEQRKRDSLLWTETRNGHTNLQNKNKKKEKRSLTYSIAPRSTENESKQLISTQFFPQRIRSLVNHTPLPFQPLLFLFPSCTVSNNYCHSPRPWCWHGNAFPAQPWRCPRPNWIHWSRSPSRFLLRHRHRRRRHRPYPWPRSCSCA